jgi:hypothetical protein
VTGRKVGTSADGTDVVVYDGESVSELAGDSCLHLEEIEEHVRRHYGPITSVLHEIASEWVHLDVLIVRPEESRRSWTFVTAGMSDRPMTLGPDSSHLDHLRHAELVIALPEERWADDLNALSGGEEGAYYPIKCLKWLARFPHRYGTWLGYGHTIPVGDPPEPIGPDTEMCGFVLGRAVTRDPSFDHLGVADGKRINLLAVYPLYESEMDFKLENGVEALFERMKKQGVTEIFDAKVA